MKIAKINRVHLRNDAYFQLNSDFRDLVNRYGAQNLKIKPMFEEWLKLFQKVDDAFRKINKSALTQKIHEADKARDEIYAAMVEMVNANMKSWEPEVKSAANRLKILFNTYGNVARKPINEQTSAIVNILQELRGNYASDCAIIRIEDWVERLALENERFSELMTERYDEGAAKSDTVMKDVRKELDLLHAVIIERLYALSVIEEGDVFEQFIKTLNLIVSKYGGKSPRSRSASAQHNGEDENGGGGEETYYGGGEETGGEDGEYDLSQIQEYDPNKHWTEYQLGDLVKSEGIIYRVKDLGQIHYPPYSKLGPLGWERVN